MTGKILRIVLWITAVLAVIGYVTFAASGLGSPSPRDPLEAAVLEHATRLAHGQPFYVDPDGASTLELMPGLPFVVAGLVRMLDAGLWGARFVDLLATLLAAGLAVMLVYRETRSVTIGAASGGLLILGEALVDAGPASGHPHSLMLALVLTACVLLRHGSSILGAIEAALLLAAACFTHAAGLWFAFAALFYLVVQDRRRLAAYAAAMVVFVGGGQVALSLGLGPWFDYHAWNIPFGAVRFEPFGLVHFLGAQVLGVFGVLALGIVLSLALPSAPWRGDLGIWLWMVLAGLGAGIASTQSANGGADAMRPAGAMLAVAGPILMQRVTQHLSVWPGSSRVRGQVMVLSMLALQFVTLMAHMTTMLRRSG